MVEIVNMKSDDPRWLAKLDEAEFRTFLENPYAWVASNTPCPLADKYIVTFRRESILPSSKIFCLIGRASRLGTNCETKLIEVTVNVPNATGGTPSRWDGVQIAFPGGVSTDILYKKDPSNSRVGIAFPHMDLGSDSAKLASFVLAVLLEPAGLGPWMTNNPVSERDIWVNSTMSAPIQRMSGTKDYFRSHQLPVDLTIMGEEAPSSACPDGNILVACNSNEGPYTGDPTQEDTLHDVDVVTIKPYCVDPDDPDHGVLSRQKSESLVITL
jgi:hypothetical protein